MTQIFRSATERDVVVIEFPRPQEFPLDAVRELLSLSEAEIVGVSEVGVVTRAEGGELSTATTAFDDCTNPLSAFAHHRPLSLAWEVVVDLCSDVRPGRCAALFVLELAWATDLSDELDWATRRMVKRQALPVEPTR